MSKLLTGYIDVAKLSKDKIKDGKKGQKFVNVTVWLNDEEDQYGNIASIQESTTKEERDSGVKANYIGNLKDPKSGQAPAADSAPAEAGDLPF